MRVVFVYPDLASDNPDYTGYFYHGIAYLSAVLKKAGHQTNLIQFTREITDQEFQERVKALQPDLIGFSSTSHVFPFVQRYAAAAKQVYRAPIICGGVHASISPEQVLEDKNIDMVCIGEGERPLQELCQRMENKQPIEGIASIWSKRNGQIFKNKVRPFIQNLDALPLPDRQVYNYPALNLEKQGIGTFMFSRGCPYQCSFCCEATLRKLYPVKPNSSKYFRFRSPQSAILELKKVIADYPFIKFVRFDDDLLFAKKDWVREFTGQYRRVIGLPFSADMRIDLIDEELLDLLQGAGLHLLRFGLESGNDFILKEVLNKNITVEQIKQAFALCQNKGIKTQAYNMVGLPYESAGQVLQTIKLNAQINPDISVVSIFYPYKGTKLYNVCLGQGFLEKEGRGEVPKNYYTRSILNLPSIRQQQIHFFFHYFHLLKIFYSFLDKSYALRPLVFLSDKVLTGKYFPEIAKVTLTPLRKLSRWFLHILTGGRFRAGQTFNTEAQE